MLFNSYIFIFVFLPITLLVYFAIGGRGNHRIAIAWLVGASLLFYGWWNPAYLWLILASVLFNYGIGVYLSGDQNPARKLWLIAGIIGNLGLIAYYKYSNFFVDNFNQLFESSYHLETILLPLAISFFTFQQISYLIDAYRGETKEYNFLHYCLFVTFFPQLIAGPIVHHKEMLPQFAKDLVYKINHKDVAVGLTIFCIGLFKKVVLADGVAVYATPVFDAAEHGVALTFFEAWGGSIAYTLQIYFDFSGYSDMAIGLARMFGILLPLNFHSPYKSKNIIEFWRHWHMTLSRFLRDYVYIALGGNKKGKTRRYINLMATMLLGGLWHGAAWTFVAWGALHGFYLICNHAWHMIRKSLGQDLSKTTLWGTTLATLTTFLCVLVAWVFFRAESFGGAMQILNAMAGSNGISLPAGVANQMPWLSDMGFIFDGMFINRLGPGWGEGVKLMLILLFIAFFLPNTQQIMRDYKPALQVYDHDLCVQRFTWVFWKPTLVHTLTISCVFYYSISHLTKVTEFLYFNF